jgi:hypothetical protein
MGDALVLLECGCLRMRGGCIEMERAFGIRSLNQPAECSRKLVRDTHLNQLLLPDTVGITTAVFPITSAIAEKWFPRGWKSSS